jgi:hypothetical protein
LHGSSPEVFQNWLEEIVKTEETLGNLAMRDRYIVVNAWNEWAEGAHLEPDTKYGYAYLNSIGRVLSEISYEDTHHLTFKNRLYIEITFGEAASSEVRTMNYIVKRFLHSLNSSQTLKMNQVTFKDAEIYHIIQENIDLEVSEKPSPEYRLHFERLVIFQPTDIDNLFKFSLRNPNYVVCGNTLNEPTLTYKEDSVVHYKNRGNLQLIPSGLINGWKISPLTRIFNCGPIGQGAKNLPRVNVIVRFHVNADMNSLFDCLKSLYSQTDVDLTVHLCLQDIIDLQFEELNLKIEIDFDSEHFKIVMHRFTSTNINPDLRSLMLNETIKKIIEDHF